MHESVRDLFLDRSSLLRSMLRLSYAKIVSLQHSKRAMLEALEGSEERVVRTWRQVSRGGNAVLFMPRLTKPSGIGFRHLNSKKEEAVYEFRALSQTELNQVFRHLKNSHDGPLLENKKTYYNSLKSDFEYITNEAIQHDTACFGREAIWNNSASLTMWDMPVASFDRDCVLASNSELIRFIQPQSNDDLKCPQLKNELCTELKSQTKKTTTDSNNLLCEIRTIVSAYFDAAQLAQIGFKTATGESGCSATSISLRELIIALVAQ